MMSITLVYLGRVAYGKALALQQQLAGLRKENLLGDVLLLLEHPAVLTLGRNAHRENILLSESALAGRGIEVVETNRGGDVTYHGPGQLVGYPILDLHGFTPHLSAVTYVRKLEEVLVRVCGEYGILTGRIAGRTGVWTTTGGSIQEKKIAAIGVHLSRWVTSHGFALNVTAGPEDFSLIVPCGIANRGVTSIAAEIDERFHHLPSLEETAQSVARHFGRVFARSVFWVESLADLDVPEGAVTAPLHQS